MIQINNKNLSGLNFIDLFAGLGGFRIALESLGAKCVYSNEWEKNVAKVYHENFGDYPDGDITKIDEKIIPNHDILCAGFPCQAFSISGKQLGFEDSRGTLFFDVARIVKEKQPKVVLLENVKNFATHDNGRTLQVVKKIMAELGYTFFEKVLNAADYGIPQNRERIYMVCFRNDLKITNFAFPNPFKLETFLEDLLLDESEVEFLYKDKDDIVLKNYNNLTNLNKTIRVGQVRNGGQGDRIYSVKGIAITLSAYGGGTFSKTGGYLMNNNKIRKLHPRECARVMGFPDSYKISSSPNQSYQQFGNSVVVDVIQLIGQKIGECLSNERVSI